MLFPSFFQAIEDLPIGTVMRESAIAFPLAESVHVLALTFVVGSIGMVDLRLLGVSARNHSVTQLTNDILPWTWGAFVVAAVTGLLMFTGQATSYITNIPFLVKMCLLACAALNMVIFHFVTQRTMHQWDRDTATPVGAKIAGVLSLTFWIGVVAFGRWIGFTI